MYSAPVIGRTSLGVPVEVSRIVGVVTCSLLLSSSDRDGVLGRCESRRRSEAIPHSTVRTEPAPCDTEH